MTRSLAWLEDSLRAVDRVFFHDTLAEHGVRIEWMRWRQNTRTFRLGCFRFKTNTIEINPVLAHDWVPDYTLVGTIWHEALHLSYGPVHSEEFYAAESRFPHFAADTAWQRDNFERLIAARPPKVR